MMKGFSILVCGVASLVLCVGCGEANDRPETIPVKGTLLLNGKPLKGAEVSFWHEKASRAASGSTDAEGKFTLSMFQFNDGAMPGENIITVTKGAVGGTSGPDPMAMLNDPTAMANAAAQGKDSAAKKTESEVPAKYMDQKKSPLKETVSAENNEFVIQLAD